WRILIPDLISAWQQIHESTTRQPTPAGTSNTTRQPAPVGTTDARHPAPVGTSDTTRHPARVGTSDARHPARVGISGTAWQSAPVGTSLRRWAHALAEEATAPTRVAQLPVWQHILAGDEPVLGARELDATRDSAASVDTVHIQVPADVTDLLLNTVPTVFRGGVDDGLLTGLALALARWHQTRGVSATSTLIRLEGHGRQEQLIPGADLSHTLGWLTAMFPVRLDITGIDLADAFAGGPAAGKALKTIKEQLRAVPDNGMGYGLLRHLNPETAAVLAQERQPRIGFNYLGKASSADIPQELRGLGWAPDSTHQEVIAAPDGDMPVLSALEINTVAVHTPEGEELTAYFGFPTGVLSREEVSELAGLWVQALTALARHTASPDAGGLTPSEAPLIDVRQEEIDTWETRLGKLTHLWPATPAQSGILFHTMMAEAANDPYQVQLVVRLSGGVDPERMRRAGQALLERHDVLRAAFVHQADGDVVQVVPETVTLPWQYLDLSDADEAERTETFERFLAQDRATRFDMGNPPLFRLALALFEPDRPELVLTAHHTLFDGWSTPLLMRDLLLLYASDGDRAGPPQASNYGEFLAWLARQDRDEAARVWTAELEGLEGPTLLAPDSAGADHGGRGQVDIALPPDEARELSHRAAELGITVNSLVQGAWALLLSQLTGRQDVVFGATVSGRPPAVADVESMVGMFINSVPVRVSHTPADTLAEVVTRLQDQQAGLVEYHYYGLTEIQKSVGVQSLFDTLVVFESFPIDRDGLTVATDATAGITFTGFLPSAGNNYPLCLAAAPEPHLQLMIQYAPGFFDRDTVEGYAARLLRILRQLATTPELRVAQLDSLEPAERDRLLTGFEDTAAQVRHATLIELVEAQAARTPDAVAVVTAGETLTYAELDARAERLAVELTAHGVGPETVVSVVLPRTSTMVVALLGVLKAGGAYLPVDPAYARSRLPHILPTARPHLILADTDTHELVPTTPTPIPIPILVLDNIDLHTTTQNAVASQGSATTQDAATARDAAARPSVCPDN
ncbi:condensation domain-containing protein, partial [Streptomyces albipurpureus]